MKNSLRIPLGKTLNKDLEFFFRKPFIRYGVSYKIDLGKSLKDLVMKKSKKNFFYLDELDSSSEEYEDEYPSFSDPRVVGIKTMRQPR